MLSMICYLSQLRKCIIANEKVITPVLSSTVAVKSTSEHR